VCSILVNGYKRFGGNYIFNLQGGNAKDFNTVSRDYKQINNLCAKCVGFLRHCNLRSGNSLPCSFPEDDTTEDRNMLGRR